MVVAVERKNERETHFSLNDLAYLLNLYHINVITCHKMTTL